MSAQADPELGLRGAMSEAQEDRPNAPTIGNASGAPAERLRLRLELSLWEIITAVVGFGIALVLLLHGIVCREPQSLNNLPFSEGTFVLGESKKAQLDGEILDAVERVVLSKADAVNFSAETGKDGWSASGASITLARDFKTSGRLIEALVFSPDCSLKFDRRQLELGEGCSKSGMIVTAAGSPAQVTGTNGEHSVPPLSTVSWQNAAGGVTLSLNAEQTKDSKVFKRTTLVRVIRGRLSKKISFRKSAWTSCEVQEQEFLELNAVGEEFIQAGLQFSIDGQGLEASLGSSAISSAVCRDAECKLKREPCGLSQELLSQAEPAIRGFFSFSCLGVCYPAWLWWRRRRRQSKVARASSGAAGILLFAVALPATGYADADPKVDANPAIFVVAAGMPCPGGGADASIVASTKNDIRTFRASGLAVQELVPEREQMRMGLETAARNGLLRRGVVLYYTGHAVLKQESRNSAASTAIDEAQTHLCLEGGTLSMSELLGWLDAQPRASLPWSVVVLDACESAYVRLDGMSMPITVIAASPQPIPVGGSDRPFVRGVVEALAHPSLHDANVDGMVSDCELLASIDHAVATSNEGGEAAASHPRLQRQAPSSLPLRFYNGSSKVTDHLKEMSSLAARLLASNSSTSRAVGQAIIVQLDLERSTRLPSLDWDLVVSDVTLPMGACPGREVEGVALCIEGRPDLRLLEQNFGDVAGDIARFSTALEVYQVRVVQRQTRWYDISRLRDDRLMAVVRSSPVGAVPGRFEVLAQTPGGSQWLGRATRVLPPVKGDAQGQLPQVRELISRQRRFTVCEQEEGQCFVASKD